ncbi:hypothetical protein [Streptomyces sp. NPDC051572]|uniref:hypothetical protein n=1 Tax=Streptomyces sp. NPDC051572 TaxID=3155802 RepID=UPI00344CBCDD
MPEGLESAPQAADILTLQQLGELLALSAEFIDSSPSPATQPRSEAPAATKNGRCTMFRTRNDEI